MFRSFDALLLLKLLIGGLPVLAGCGQTAPGVAVQAVDQGREATPPSRLAVPGTDSAAAPKAFQDPAEWTAAATFSVMLVEQRIVDLTYPFDDQTIYWPTETGFDLQRGPAGVTARGYFYAANRFAAAEHGGTHIDAPIHFFDGGDTADRIPLTRLVGPAAVVDVRDKCAADADYQIHVGDLRDWEVRHGQTLGQKIVLLHTGWGQFWPDRARYLGTSETGLEGVARLHFPGLHADAALWLVEQRDVRAVGIDTASIDHGQSQLFRSHVTLFSRNVPAFENVANLSELPATGVAIVALPMKIGGGSGGPLRIIALLPPVQPQSPSSP